MKILAIRSIHWYQKYLSPHKGYRCAHAAFHGGPSCSQAVIEIIEAKSYAALPAAVLGRFKACRAASQQLHQQKRKRRRRQERNDEAECCFLMMLPFDFLN
ncbi:membrane protein insertion efficiency factor YidD [Photobacterium sp. 1_MG-2023]|uniref:membrane protein insertion efficiency factor YidD n=1 Tax=Photobacterium sp. 1_MG-2023 TaxID=3062646 RepID=UPI0026E3587A|nr:membrane protein insertion efficiency factor YidD [Photobacterium sp. 1_MG-2023]MDO6704985.1 membrane protein insertion efficiency factor YidD [Photobacterium sp. 1_MG-2023]